MPPKERVERLISVVPVAADLANRLMDSVDLHDPRKIRPAITAFFIEIIKG
jgi:hypothetical protein